MDERPARWGAWLGVSLTWLVVTFRGQVPGDIART